MKIYLHNCPIKMFLFIYLTLIFGVANLYLDDGVALGNDEPTVFFSDLTWGPNSGWEGSTEKGAAVSIWGKRLGTSGTINCGGVSIPSNDSDYVVEWGTTGDQNGVSRGIERITFFLKSVMSTAANQSITVTVNGITSNPIPFDVITSDEAPIYFIDFNEGDNSDDGTTRATAWKELYMFNPDNSDSKLNDAQYICYVRDGTYGAADESSRSNNLINMEGLVGAADKKKALIGYPGELPVADVSARGRLFDGDQDDDGTTEPGGIHYNTIAKFKVTRSGSGTGGVAEFWGDNNRLVGVWAKDIVSTEKYWTGIINIRNGHNNKIYGLIMDGCGSTAPDADYTHNIYIKYKPHKYAGDHGIRHVHIGWSEFKNTVCATDHGGQIFTSVEATESGMDSQGVWDFHIFSNYFYNNNMEDLSFGSGSSQNDMQFFIYNNIFDSSQPSGTMGIKLNKGIKDFHFFNNVFYRLGDPSSASAIRIRNSAHNVTFKNNIWVSSGDNNFIVNENGSDNNVVIENDLFYNPSGSTIIPTGEGFTVTSTTSLTANPFINSLNNNFHLNNNAGAGLLAIDAGSSSVSYLVDSDYDGNSRPIDGDDGGTAEYDIGAHEYGSQTLPAGTPPTINGIEDQTIDVDAPFTFDLSVYVTEPDGDDITYALDSGSDPLPDGLTLSADGTISGTPTEESTRDITIVVTDKDGQASQNHTDGFELTVVEESNGGGGGGGSGGGCFISLL